MAPLDRHAWIAAHAPKTGELTITAPATKPAPAVDALPLILESLEGDKAMEPVVIDLAGKTTMADHMVVATGTSQRHLSAMAEKLIQRLKAADRDDVRAEGLGDSAWVLIDAGEVIVHLFRAETRSFYDLERLWQMTPPPARPAAVADSDADVGNPPDDGASDTAANGEGGGNGDAPPG